MFRKAKIKPRLNVSRPQVKNQESSDQNFKKEPEEEKADEIEVPAQPEEPEKVFSPPPAPVQTPRENDTNAQISTKFRKPKPAPRLNVARATQKASEAESPSKNDEIQQQPSPSTSLEPDPVFSPPPVPASPMRSRSDTPRDLLQSPTYSVNHNAHYPPTPQSPFMPIPHPRIRTESLSSIKSIPANLQPRKKFRSEDQKILDNKRESRERLSNKNVEKSQLRMFDMIYYNPTTNPMKSKTSNKDQQSEDKSAQSSRAATPQPESEPTPSSTPVPQLRLNAQGELVLDEASLVVENEEHRRNRILLASTNVVYYDEHSTNYGFYKRQKRTREWPHEETVKFYRCLNTVGTDFSLMLNLFPNRTRRDLKLKFKKEEKNNPQLIDKALLKFNTFDLEELQRDLEKEDEEKRKEMENGSSEVKELVKRKILKKQEAKAKVQQQIKSKIEKILSNGDEAIKIVERVEVSNEKPPDITENFKEKKEKRAIKRKTPMPNVVRASKRRVKSISEDPDIETLTCNNPIIKLEKKEEKQSFDIIQQTLMEEASNDWSNDNSSNIIDDHPQYPLINTETPFDNLLPAKMEVIEEPEQEPCYEEDQISHEAPFEEETQNTPVEQIPEPSEIKSPIQEPAAENLFDEEEFLNSLNLEKLSIVVRHVDDTTFYDIHETDPITQIMAEKPLNIPQHLKDILISVMTQED